MKILVSQRQKDAASYFRSWSPFAVLRYRTNIEIHYTEPALGVAQVFDVLWMQMDASSFAEVVVREFQEAGKTVVYDVDDWLFAYPPSWPGFDDYFERGTTEALNRLGFHERLLHMADIITTTTPYLAGKLRGLLGDKDIRVLPNFIVRGDWDALLPMTHDNPGPVIGWFGSGTHWDEWVELAPALDEALLEVNGYLSIIGMPEAVSCFPPRLAERTFVQPLVRMREFPKIRRLITAFDAGLAWCTERLESAKCRSPLKALQYGAAGVPVFASRTVYGEVPGLCDRFGMVFDTPADLAEGLVAALLNGGALRARAKRWRAEVFRKYTYERQAMRWLEVLNDIQSRFAGVGRVSGGVGDGSPAVGDTDRDSDHRGGDGA